MAEIQRFVDHVLIWSDQKIFTVEAVTSTHTQYDRQHAREAGDLTKDSRTNLRRTPDPRRIKPAGSKTPSVFIDVSVKVNTHVYIKNNRKGVTLNH